MMKESGISLLELVLEVAMFVMVALVATVALQSITRHTAQNKDKAFAVQKVIQIMEELRGLVAGGTLIDPLDNYQDTVRNYVLTTKTDVTDPCNPVSDNCMRRYTRWVEVDKIPEEANARKVTAQIFRSDSGTLLAQTVSVLRTLQNRYAATQVYDLYALEIENMAGPWSHNVGMAVWLYDATQDLSSRNPGLEFRIHPITRLAYGRDPYYRPNVNMTCRIDNTDNCSAGSPQRPADWVYWYPGKYLRIANQDDWLFSPGIIAFGRLNLDGIPRNTNAYAGLEYPLVDEFNHAVRYPDEVALYAGATNYALSIQATYPEVSLRMFLEQMHSQPANFHTLLLVNVNEAFFPVVPMRNYSDPAKDPANHANMRVVTHPENLQYVSGSSVTLRVYSYVQPDYNVLVDSFSETAVVDTMTVVITSMTATFGPILPENIHVYTVAGSSSGLLGPYSSSPWPSASLTAVPTAYYTVSSVANQILITLYHSPLRHAYSDPASGGDSRGLPSNQRLYGLEYIPCRVGNPTGTSFVDGDRDLTDTTAAVPKNTARWKITIDPGFIPDGQYKIETRFGSNLAQGWPFGVAVSQTTGSNAPLSNVSRTYVWVGVAPPVTEQYQFMGDPRFMPYSDVKQQHRYNWFFNPNPIGPSRWDGYSGFTEYGPPAANPNPNFAGWATGWNNEFINYDMPRYFALFRSALLKTGAVFSNIRNNSAFGDLGLGGEITGFPSMQMFRLAWDPTAGDNDLTYVNEISSDALVNQVYSRLIATQAGSQWVSLPWLGELFPDNQFTQWSGVGSGGGNLRTGSDNFFRARYTDSRITVLPTYFSTDVAKGTGYRGIPSFINGSGAGGNKKYSYNDVFGTTGTLTASSPPTDRGAALQGAFNLALLPQVSVSYPFTFNDGRTSPGSIDMRPPEWLSADYSVARTTISREEVYYAVTDPPNPNYYSSYCLIRVSTGTPPRVFYMPMGNYDAYSPGNVFAQGEHTLAQMVRGFMAGGNLDPPMDPTIPKIPQIPLVILTTPTPTSQYNNPTTINVGWTINWKRWDLQPYTTNYASSYDGGITPDINIKVSWTNGASWVFADDISPATAGVYSFVHRVLVNPFTWNVSEAADWPQGTYLLRIEAFRPNEPLHYTYHQVEIFIKR